MATDQNTESYKKQTPEANAAPSPGRKAWRWLAAAACVLTVAAWIAMMGIPSLSIGCALAGLATAVWAAIMAKPSLWRDVAYACIVACAVLLLVFGIFHFGITYVIKSLG